MAHSTSEMRVTVIPLGRRLLGACSNLPERLVRTWIPGCTPRRPYSVLPRWACRAGPVAATRGALYRTVSPLPFPAKYTTKPAVCSLWHFPWGYPRRTLSGTVCPWSPDFPPRRPFGLAGAAVQPTDAVRDGERMRPRQDRNRSFSPVQRASPAGPAASRACESSKRLQGHQCRGIDHDPRAKLAGPAAAAPVNRLSACRVIVDESTRPSTRAA